MKIRLLLLLLSCHVLAWSQSARQSSENAWTPEDIIHTESMQSVQFSPDNSMLVWTKKRGLKKEDKFVSDIYLTRLQLRDKEGFKTIQLTHRDENDHSPMFSRDGETIYFLSSREEGKKLWALSIYGGEPQEVHTFEEDISDLSWLNDSTLTYVSSDGKSLFATQKEEQKDNTVVVEDSVHWTIDRVYAFDIKHKTTRRLTENDYPVSGYAVSRDGRWLLTALRMSPHYGADGHPKPRIYLYDLQNGEKTQILKDLQTPGDFQFTHDHQGFYFVAETSSDPEWNGAGISELYYFDLTRQAYTKVDLGWENGLGMGYALSGADVLAFMANGATNQLAFYQKKGQQWKKSALDFGAMNDHIGSIALSEDGKKIVFEHSTAAQLPKYHVASLSEKEDRLQLSDPQEMVKLNRKLQNKPTARYEILRWKGYKGEEVNGILYYPQNYEAGKKYPLVLSIHGGPSGVDLDLWRERWSTFPQLYTQRGAFVLKPNYHGSSNHGLAFVESIKKNYYEPELTDIINGINLLVDKGMVDKKQLGAAGWSNGAILTTMLTVQYPDMFKAAAPGAGDVNWTSDYGTCQFGVTFDQSYFGGAPWDDVAGKSYNETYILKSPLFEMEKVKTPTIIFHGSEDRAVPRDQGWEYYRALQQNNQAPVRFLWFPGQEHGLSKITHQLRKMKEELAWFDQYLFKTYKPENETLKEESPLALLLKREKAAAQDGLYGKLHKGILMPEVAEVKKDSIAIGCFEVTQAQYKAFKPSHTYKAGNANKPVSRVSLQDAQAYVQWLSQKTGESYRLPNAREARKLQEQAHQAGVRENTLNYWAGYDITLDEVRQFRQKLQEVKSSLIKEVGSFKPVEVGQARLYDLGGNVAEYTAEGGTYGYSAYDFVDPHSRKARPSPEHIGFRVVREAK